MRHSVLSRFQGAIAGCRFSQTPQENFLSVHLELSETLITSGGLGEKQWQQISHPYGKNPTSSAQLTLFLLPVFLFFHENLSLLKQQLEPARAFCRDLDDVFLWGTAMAWVIQEKQHPTQLLEQLLSYHCQTQSKMLEQLKLIQTCLSKNTGLKQVVAKLARQGSKEQTALALSLYCFLYTPEDFSLSVNRAMNTGSFAPLVSCLTGALAGGYNSYIGIPLLWRLATEEALINQIESLFFAWCGVYQPNFLAVSAKEAIASPGIIQPRSSFELISQKSD